MKQKIIILFTIYLLFNSALSAQNIEKMNKSELREHIVILTTKIDSLKNANFYLEQSISVEISIKKELILKNENERKRIISENKIAISKLNEIITTLKNSISSVQTSSNVVSTSTTFNRNDFLNKYYFDQIPLPNNSFSLVLSKLVYGDKSSANYIGYDEDYQGAVRRLPEILDANAFTYWEVKPNFSLGGGSRPENDIISKNIDYFNSKLPKIEVLKNKLFTIKYNDGSEESFLFNVKQIESDDNNNQRKILQIELANEEVKADGSNNTAKDIVWRFFAIENECYLALTFGQLIRLNLNLISVKRGIEVFSKTNQTIYMEYSNLGYRNSNREGIFLSRNKDLFMASSNYINPKEIIYLFKLK